MEHTMRKILIGLGYRPLVGKSTIAKAIAEKYGFNTFSFSSEIVKDIEVARQSGVNEMVLWIWKNEMHVGGDVVNFGETEWLEVLATVNAIRKLNPEVVSNVGMLAVRVALLTENKAFLQLWGTNYRRKLDPGYWVTKMIDYYNKSEVGVVVENVRFLNEVEAIKKLGGYVAEVRRVTKDGEPIALEVNDRLGAHLAENELAGYSFDKVIYNYENDLERTLKEVFEWVDSLVGGSTVISDSVLLKSETITDEVNYFDSGLTFLEDNEKEEKEKIKDKIKSKKGRAVE
jgi:hypothetical protein